MTALATWRSPGGETPSGTGGHDIVSLVDAGCRAAPASTAIVFDDGLHVSRGEFRQRVERLAGHLARSVRPGDRVAVMLGNRVEYMTSCIAAVANRGVIVALGPDLAERDLVHILRDTAPVAVITDDPGAQTIRSCRRAGVELPQLLIADRNEPDGLARYNDGTRLPLAAAGCQESDPVAVYYTSGTSGSPKPCLFQHDHWLYSVDAYLRVIGVDDDDRVLYPLPFCNEAALWHLLLAMAAGTTMVALRRFSASRFWGTVRAFGVTQLYSAGAIPTVLFKQPPRADDREHGLRLVVSSDVPAQLDRELAERWGVHWLELYGLTEVGIASVMPPESAGEMIGSGSVGLPCPEVTVRVVDEAGKDVPVGEAGEIVIAADTPGLMSGYYNRPDATAALIRDGWLHTGDRGRADADGYLYIAGRSEDIICRGADFVVASEVEQVLRTHPQIVDAAVVAAPDEILGQEVMAHIRLAPRFAAGQLPAADIVEFCARRLASFKVPRILVHRHAPFALGPTLRIRKHELVSDPAALGDDVFDRTDMLGW